MGGSCLTHSHFYTQFRIAPRRSACFSCRRGSAGGEAENAGEEAGAAEEDTEGQEKRNCSGGGRRGERGEDEVLVIFYGQVVDRMGHGEIGWDMGK